MAQAQKGDWVDVAPTTTSSDGWVDVPVQKQAMAPGTMQTHRGGDLINVNNPQFPLRDIRDAVAVGRANSPQFQEQLKSSQDTAIEASPYVIGAATLPLGIGAGAAMMGVGEFAKQKAQGASTGQAAVGGATTGALTYAGGKVAERAIPYVYRAGKRVAGALTGSSQIAKAEAERALGQAAAKAENVQTAQAGKKAESAVAQLKALEPTGEAGKWMELSQAVRAPSSSVAVGRGASSLDDAYSIAGRGLAKEGFDPAILRNMTPNQQAALVTPRWNAAGKEVDKIVGKATASGAKVDLRTSIAALIRDKIPSGKMREEALKIVKETAEEVDLTSLLEATPEQALALRRALKAQAKFGPQSNFSTVRGLATGLYRSVTNDLHKAVPELAKADIHYGDMTSAVASIQTAMKNFATGKLRPVMSMAEKSAAKLPNVSPYNPGPLPVDRTGIRMQAAKRAAAGVTAVGALEVARRALGSK